jgi:hypothetical protein
VPATDDDNGLCSMCGHSAVWHRESNPRHKFNADPGSLNETPPKIVAESSEPEPYTLGVGTVTNRFQQQAAQLMIDPVLRMALVNAGVITVEQIDAAQRMSDTLNGVAHESSYLEASDFDG